MSTIQFKEANCKNCYKCIRSCPVKAITFQHEQAQIVEEDCMLCGNCLLVCPQNAKSVKSDIEKVKGFIDKNEKVYASIAPSFVSAFGKINEKKIFAILRKLGFTHIEETAVGAAQVSLQYERLLKERKMKNIITTACPSITFLVQKYYPELVNQLAPVVSPMIAHARMMKAMYGPRIRVVFIGPCLSKKQECNDLQNEGVVDAVITFEELEKWMKMSELTFEDVEDENMRGVANGTARFYPAPGGILKTLHAEERKNYKCVSVDGIERCMKILDSFRDDEAVNYFVEMNSCTGGCLGGPCMRQNRGGYLEARDRLIAYVKRSAKECTQTITDDTKVEFKKTFVDKPQRITIPDEDTIQGILNSIGKSSKDKELNCGACGYPTCREKAVAVYNHRAELHMCLPYMRERAESISNIIIGNTPNAIIALDMELCIQELNLSAQRMFHLNQEEAKNKSIYDLLQCTDFQEALEKEENILDRKQYYERYGMTVMQSVLYVKEHHVVIVIIKDITKDEKEKQQMYKVRSETVEIAQKVIEKQMRVAQEIASLLGETTAETKVALTKLKNSILAETGENK